MRHLKVHGGVAFRVVDRVFLLNGVHHKHFVPAGGDQQPEDQESERAELLVILEEPQRVALGPVERAVGLKEALLGAEVDLRRFRVASERQNFPET